MAGRTVAEVIGMGSAGDELNGPLVGGFWRVGAVRVEYKKAFVGRNPNLNERNKLLPWVGDLALEGEESQTDNGDRPTVEEGREVSF